MKQDWAACRDILMMRSYATLRDMRRKNETITPDHEALLYALEEQAGLTTTSDELDQQFRALGMALSAPESEDE